MTDMKKLKGKWVSFIGSPQVLFKVLDEDKNYILVGETGMEYWERKEYIETIKEL